MNASAVDLQQRFSLAWEPLVETVQALLTKRLVVGSVGNASIHIDERVLVTPDEGSV